MPPEVLPTVVRSSGVVEQTDPRHLGWSLPIAGLAGDQQAALFGQGCVSPGLAKNTYGTGAFLLVLTGDRVPSPAQGLLATAACGPRASRPTRVEGSVFVAGAAVQWLRDGLGVIEQAAETEALARSVLIPAGSTSFPRLWAWEHRTGNLRPGERSPV